MTWNLWWRFGDHEAREPAIVEAISATAPDVLCVQECWATEDEHQLDRLCDQLNMEAVRTEPIFYNGQAFCNAVLSRWPVEPLGEEALPDATGEPGHRRIVAGAVDTPWGRWPVASTHLDHRFDASATRQIQVRRVLELIAGWRGDGSSDLPVILGADLNAVPDSDEVRMLTGRRQGIEGIVMSDAWEQSGDGLGHTWVRSNPNNVDSAWPDRRIDYLLVSWPRPKPIGNPTRAWLVAEGAIGPVWASDHAAVAAEFVTP